MLKIAHRGASAYLPENTISAFLKGIEMGAHGIELDAHLCASGEIVVLHDDTVERTTSGHGQVAQMTLEQLRALQINGGEHIPTLDEVFQAIGKSAHIFVEVKHANAAVKAGELIEHYIQQGYIREKLCLISFQHDGLKAARNAFPHLPIGQNYKELPPDFIARAQSMDASYILPSYRKLTKAHIDRVREAELKTVCWTVNTPADIASMKALGVNGIIGNYPDRL